MNDKATGERANSERAHSLHKVNTMNIVTYPLLQVTVVNSSAQTSLEIAAIYSLNTYTLPIFVSVIKFRVTSNFAMIKQLGIYTIERQTDWV